MVSRGDPNVWTFFYGSYMNFDVLAEVDLSPTQWEAGRVADLQISIAPRANLTRSEGDVVYGIVAKANHAELNRLYAHARDVLGEVYLPEAVLVETDMGARPALCYISHDMDPRPADPAYVHRIVAAAKRCEFPAEYVERLESFA